MTSIALLLIAIGIMNMDFYSNEEFKFESINTKNMAKVAISNKSDELDPTLFLTNISSSIKDTKKEKIEEVELENINKVEVIKKNWRLPTEIGQITQYPNYYHTAYDIISPRGYSEAIYPVYDGVVSSIYYDYAGALIVTILHDVEGTKYTSQYVHLSRFQDGLHVGQNVTTNDVIGYMGASGIASGVHLHLTVVDCNLYGDGNCGDLNSFYNYARRRLNEGYYGLGVQLYVPDSWNSR
jgi:murein DD-endopeptidase MepM/ murein hydrolase activator NlpD